MLGQDQTTTAGTKPAIEQTPESVQAITSLLYQVLETELGGVQIYRTALECAVESRLREDWTHFLAETERHVVVARALLERLGLDPDADVPARLICRHQGQALVERMLEGLSTGTAADICGENMASAST